LVADLTALVSALSVLASILACIPTFMPTSASAQVVPKPQHVFIIVLENEGYDDTFGANSPALYLNALGRSGALLKNYYGIGHNSLDNYIAMVSGQAPNPATQADCERFADFKPAKSNPESPLDGDGQAVGAGCVYPASVRTIADQMESAHLTWKAYMEDMGNVSSRESATCGHPGIGDLDNTQAALVGDQYATRHNPFMYFHSVIDNRPNCDAHVVNLAALERDLLNEQSTANYVFITPNLCHDGHDAPCVNNEPGGLLSADKFLMQIVPRILNSPAYKDNGLLIVTFDEADVYIRENKLISGDVSACCDEPPGPNTHAGTVFGTADNGPGILGPGGGRIGAVLLSRYIREGTVSDVPYNHYSLLRSVEDFFGLEHLGYAGRTGLKSFGDDVFTEPSGNKY
jgi:phospholipase C